MDYSSLPVFYETDIVVCVRAGAEYSKGNPKDGKNQPTSLRYIVSGVDFEKFGEFILENNKKQVKHAAEFTERAMCFMLLAVMMKAGPSVIFSIKL